MKSLILTACLGVGMLALSSCGGDHTPLTAEEMQAAAEAMALEMADSIGAAKDSECAESFEAAVEAKVQEMKAQ